MKLDDLRPAAGANQKRKRKGRGIAAGQGKTAGRGTKGQRSRSGGTKGPFFEGGQLPLVRRLPHIRGFKNIFRQEFDVVNLDSIAQGFEANADVTPDALVQNGLIKRPARIKVLGRGQVDKPLKVSAHAFSDSAREKITAAGGTVTELPWTQPPRKVR